MEASELARWTRFAAKGGIGKCTALQDCVAEGLEDLMFLKDDEIIVLMQLPVVEGVYLGYCEGVVGRFHAAHVLFQSKLKKPVITKRSSITVAKTSSRVSSPTSVVISAADVDKDYDRSPGSSSTPKPDVLPHILSSRDRRSSGSPSPSLSRSSIDDQNLRRLDIPNSATSFTQPSQLSVDTDFSMPSMSYSSTSSFIDSFPNTPHSSRPFNVRNVFDSTENEQADSPRFEMPESQTRMTIQPLNIRRKPAPSATPEPRTPTTQLNQEKSEEGPLGNRVSIATSDGEVGIGLSLLQDMAAELDDHSSIKSRTSTQNIDHSPENVVSDRYITASPEAIAGSSPKSPEAEEKTTAPRGSRTSSMPTSNSLASGEDWEGAGDIYDDYRYSRFSIASKMSKTYRFSQSAGPSLAAGVDATPPLPADSHPGLDSTRIAHNSIASSDHSVYSSSIHSIPLRLSQPPTGAVRNKPPSRPPSVSVSDESPDAENDGNDDANRRSADLRSSSPTQTQDADSSESSLSAFPTPPGLENVSPALISAFAAQAPPTSIPAFTAQAPPTSTPLVSLQASPGFDFRRRGIFPPHPYAPKAPPNSAGPLYGRIPSKAWSQASRIIHPDSAISVLRQAMASRVNPDGSLRATTLYGKCESDLSNATDSVPITFGLDPPEPAPVNPLQMNIPPHLSSSYTEGMQSSSDSSTNKDETNPSGNALPRVDFFPKVQTLRPRSRSFSGFDTHITGILPLPSRRQSEVKNRASLSPLVPMDAPPSPKMSPVVRPSHSPSPLSLPPNNNVMDQGSSSTPSGRLLHVTPPPSPLVISGSVGNRQSFQRIKHASFSHNVHVEVPPSPVSRNFSSSPRPPPSPGIMASASSSPNLAPAPNNRPTTFTHNVHVDVLPSPVSRNFSSPRPTPSPGIMASSSSSPYLPPTPNSRPTTLTHTVPVDVPPSPISRNFSSSPRPPPSPGLKASPSSSPNFAPTLNSRSATHTVPVDVPPSPLSQTFSSPKPPPSPRLPASASASASSSASLVPATNNRPTTHFPRDFFPQPPKHRQSEDANVGSNSDITSPTLGRNRSLRNKMSLPALRTKSSAGPSRPEEASHVLADGRQQNSDLKTVQVKSTDFELIRPIVPQHSPVRASEDSPRDGPQFVDHGLLRVASPSQSINSTDLRSPSSVSEFAFPAAKAARPNEVDSIEAHRQRELKWMSLMSTVSSSQARKTKKIKRLLSEGVPSSVRYMVWAHLTDSKAKSVQGLYSQLASRGKALASREMEMDVRTYFRGQPQLHGAQGPVLSLLQAYLAMVPDLQYQPGLTCIAGNLLLLSPEEDAFWIFTSLMDSHLRSYFSVHSPQMDIDASLFGKALENADPQIAKKLFVEMKLSPVVICRPWFSSLFGGALPLDYIHRVWDIFLYEGIPFLFRVGLVIFSCTRRQLLEANHGETLYLTLRHVHPSLLPPTADAFISLAYSVKLKDDDIRKQRVKTEAQAKHRSRLRTMSMGPSIGARPAATSRG